MICGRASATAIGASPHKLLAYVVITFSSAGLMREYYTGTQCAWIHFGLLEPDRRPVIVESFYSASFRLYEPVDLVRQHQCPRKRLILLGDNLYLLIDARFQECMLCIKRMKLSVLSRRRHQTYPDYSVGGVGEYSSSV